MTSIIASNDLDASSAAPLPLRQDIPSPPQDTIDNYARDDLLPGIPSLIPPEGEAILYDFSLLGMYMQADAIVKMVMIGLFLASMVTWTIWITKSFELIFARRRLKKNYKILKKSSTLTEARDSLFSKNGARGHVLKFVCEALEEIQRSIVLPSEGTKERAALLLSRIESRISRRMVMGTGILATIGSIAPFLGLFGTVWGIMNAFINIARSNATSLAVISPGIAEALLTTAMGLIAAIPAVIAYNMLARSTARYKALLGDVAAETLCHLSRDLDYRAHSKKQI